jgi:predicted DNA-binding protein (UPF0251 family)
MSRPRKCRWVGREPEVTFFKPQGIPLKTLEHAQITVDELEALRLSDYEGLSHEDVARRMRVSRPTVTRMLAKAHRAVADALVNGKAICIKGGDYCLAGENFCPRCGTHISSEQIPSQSICRNCENELSLPLQSHQH